MSQKTIKTRIINKNDIESSWLKATNFTPEKGEIIIYNKDEKNTQVRLKIGDGTSNVNDLKFIGDVDQITLNAMLEEVLV